MKHPLPIAPELGTRDGLAYALFEPEGEPQAGIVILHGASSAKESHFDFARTAVAHDMAALAFDQRGHGRFRRRAWRRRDRGRARDVRAHARAGAPDRPARVEHGRLHGDRGRGGRRRRGRRRGDLPGAGGLPAARPALGAVRVPRGPRVDGAVARERLAARGGRLARAADRAAPDARAGRRAGAVHDLAGAVRGGRRAEAAAADSRAGTTARSSTTSSSRPRRCGSSSARSRRAASGSARARRRRPSRPRPARRPGARRGGCAAGTRSGAEQPPSGASPARRRRPS